MRPVVGVVHYSDIYDRLRNSSSRVEWRSRPTAESLVPGFYPDLDALFIEVPHERWPEFSVELLVHLPAMRRLRWIHVAASGVEALLVPQIVESELIVTNAAGVLDEPIAEYILAAVASLAKQLPRTIDLQRQRAWMHRDVALLRGARTIILGPGGIGREAGRLLSAIGMTVVGVGRSRRDEDPVFGHVHGAGELEELVRTADYLINTIPLTPDTIDVVSARILAACKPGLSLVSIARGETINMPSLVRSLESGQLSAALIDGFEHEPLPKDSPYWGVPGLIVSPHMSGAIPDRPDRHVAIFTSHLDRFLIGELPNSVLDKRLGFVTRQGESS
ncbi:MAG TPA: D-2-hydroxyacid dehydrogenase [Acidothermaceae bacterium]|jgi:phosphoglycerate dehydrogenase-like enzyme